ncbi:MAG: hypothetical protein V7782_14895 [Psychromonas sp.]
MDDLGEDGKPVSPSTLMPLISNNFNYFDKDEFGNFTGKDGQEWTQQAIDEHQLNNRIWGPLTEANVDFINTDQLQNLNKWLLENGTHPATPG